MVEAGIQDQHADGDIKMDCKLTCLSETTSPTSVVAEYADVFRLLVHNANSIDHNENLYMIRSRQTVCITALKI